VLAPIVVVVVLVPVLVSSVVSPVLVDGSTIVVPVDGSPVLEPVAESDSLPTEVLIVVLVDSIVVLVGSTVVLDDPAAVESSVVLLASVALVPEGLPHAASARAKTPASEEICVMKVMAGPDCKVFAKRRETQRSAAEPRATARRPSRARTAVCEAAPPATVARAPLSWAGNTAPAGSWA
jgi:hypothetical protein